ncbi:TSUP family transporter [Roseateles cellulosilyticus]|uniref:Probable membrane transporter protein n=1 Tax=Pelomonas cellulosilytica TaxID=2906762 RepID=A0ABS8XLM9_9BURK|nr:TSUP family transporter [Pelomonas sp. P8]MCE4553704.1 TSUP family transporter [Pelomonas sp. P8]
MLELATVALASLLAGFIDAVAGGGGLVLTPALFSTYPAAMPATLMGSNKSAAIWGTGWATLQYVRRVSLPWRNLLPAAVLAALGSFTGAWVLTHVSPEGLRKALPAVLLAVFLYTLAKKDLGREHAPRFSGRAEAMVAGGIALAVGFYDGFFGPGTGSFFVFLFVRVLGYDFLHASATAKLMNLLTNAAAIALFAAKGHVWWHLAGVMAVTNVAGSLLGTRLALKHGAGFVRGVFVLVVGALILKTAFDAFIR